MTDVTDNDNLIDIKKVMEIIGLGKTMVYRLERQGKFPPRYKPGGWSSRWSEREVRAWKDEQRQGRAA
ncbi:helix-turn-helix transcriptional regulator [Sphingomonas sp. SRS2]|uniref:helix-turn-helix transcriptional regulator n=1 Tax=Sphingomonas sp. SRS2 TaxID=133190 RepID=UPI0006184133|nr:AlpA family phage regulatory protein [Sphingomonas sp. SRS2]KKC27322.1 transcriptional regulator [Sphingomonas sp. SRS2]